MSDRRSLFANDRVAHVDVPGDTTGLQRRQGQAMVVAVPVAGITRAPGDPALQRQALMGMPITCLEEHDGVAFVRDESTGYVGYMSCDALGAWQVPTHRVRARSTLLFAAPDFKAPDPVPLSLGAALTIESRDGAYGRTSAGGFAFLDHLAPMARLETDPVAVAEALLGVPYLWGGNSAFGLDCSGLVQIAMAACGLPCPGDSDQQCAVLGRSLPPGTPPRRGDLMFWKGHVGWLSDPGTLLHANVHHMAVAQEPLASAIARIEAQGDGPVLRHARLHETA